VRFLSGSDGRHLYDPGVDSNASQTVPFHIPSLDGLRAVSILIVFAGHAGAKDIIPGGLGVTVFFVVSGFLITTLLRRELDQNATISIKDFYLRRAFRILPLFYFVLMTAAIATLLLGLGRGVGFWPTLAQFFHISNYWSITQLDRPVMQGTGVYWSLAVEEHFYLIFPVLYLFLSRHLTRRQQAGVLAAICVAVLAWRYALVFGFEAQEVRTYYATDTRIDSILVGCVVAIAANPMLDNGPKPQQRLIRAILAGAAILVTLAIRDASFRETLRYTVQSVAIAFILTYVVAVPRSVTGRLLNSAPLIWFGRLSYAFYLVHLIVIMGLQQRGISTPITAVAAFVISTVLAVVLKHLIERPGLRLRKRLFGSPSQSSSSPEHAPSPTPS
jgi:peptidoglycan/LPS O-acetylase OafA/YrhL